MSGYTTLKEIENLNSRIEKGDSVRAKMYSPNPSEVEVAEAPTEPSQPEQPEVLTQVEEAKPNTSQVQEQPSDDYEQKYKVIKGRFDKDIGKLRESLVDKNTEVEDLRRINLELQKRLAANETAPSNQSAQETASPEKISVDKFDMQSSQHVSPDDAEVFGTDQIDFVRRVSKEEVEAALTSFSQSLNANLEAFANAVSDRLLAIDGKFKPVDERINTVQTDVHRTAEEIFYAELDREAPNWRTYDTDELFNLWLDEEYDTFTGRKRRVFLDEAIRNRDAKRVAKFIEAYTQTLTAQFNDANNANVAPHSDIEKQVVPNKAGDGGHVVEPTEEPAKKFSYDDYSTIEKLRRSNKITVDEADRRLAELDALLTKGQLTR